MAAALPVEAIGADLRDYRIDEDFDCVVSIGLLAFFDCATTLRVLAMLQDRVRRNPEESGPWTPAFAGVTAYSVHP